ncbi:heterokaryon incompatibility protein-domain-containing protein [Triangularia verruculosa]|uniref:Heterokaryon incompatibility protein-domain-containing protein n=1 Tax=Triangularia verruculosa TaxID=2587418 RepID=A0AAN7ARD5_9PEZI|nr:heterokaryon incompatibility protein-domain-containing protein [Triangularia verruculosa]
MRLLKARSLEFEEFLDESAIPPYAILSHRWEDEEVTYKEILKPTRRALAEAKRGFQKIKACAAEATRNGLEYLWVDTCCIDKTSSTELSEAINSMFRWYRAATVCYTYLCDVPPLPAKERKQLIAPRELVFYTNSWTRAGTKEDWARLIEDQTGVPNLVLRTGDLRGRSIAERMSWAAKRQTTRIEDAAYCLLGLFDINMPMLYGEGERAFIRLQQEIIKGSDDLSIFAWMNPEAADDAHCGLFATSPSYFATCQDVRWARPSGNDSFELTNKGLKLSLALSPDQEDKPYGFIAVLSGVRKRGVRLAGLHMQKVGPHQYARVSTRHLGSYDTSSEELATNTAFYVRQTVVMEEDYRYHPRPSSILFQLQSKLLVLGDVQPSRCWDSNAAVFTLPTPLPEDGEHLTPAIFSLQSSAAADFTADIKVTMDKPWGELVEMDPKWSTDIGYDAGNPLLAYWVDCQNSDGRRIVIAVIKDLFNQRPRLTLRVGFRAKSS